MKYFYGDTAEERIQELKENRNQIIDSITEDYPEYDLKKVMWWVKEIVTASNFHDLDIDIYETIEMAVENMDQPKYNMVDMGEINRQNAMNNLPSSMR